MLDVVLNTIQEMKASNKMQSTTQLLCTGPTALWWCVEESVVHEGAHGARASWAWTGPPHHTAIHHLLMCCSFHIHFSFWNCSHLWMSLLLIQIPKLYLKCSWLEMSCGNKSKDAFTHISFRGFILYSNRKSFLQYKINNKHQFTCSVPHFTFYNYTSCPSSPAI